MRRKAKPLGVLGSAAKTYQTRATKTAIRGVQSAIFGETPKRKKKN